MGELAKVEANPLMQYGDVGGRMNTSLDLSTDAGRKQLTACFDKEPKALTQSVGQPVLVRDYVIHTYPHTDPKTGEVSERFRLILIDMDGVAWSTGGGTLLNSFKMITFGHGMPPWTEGLIMTVRSKRREGAEGYTYRFELG
jgi:hypothetical protein